MWRSTLALVVALTTGAMAQTTVAVTVAWDLHETHAGATWELEIDGLSQACGSVVVTDTERRCTAAAVPLGTHTFRLRGTVESPDGPLVSDWSQPITDTLAGPGPFTIHALVSSGGVMAEVFTDSFTVGSNTDLDAYPSGSPDYVYENSSGSSLTVSAANDRVELTIQNVVASARIVDAAMPTGDQQITGTIGFAGTFSSGELLVRMQSGAHSGYMVKVQLAETDGQRVVLYRVVGGVHTEIATGGPTGVLTGAGSNQFVLRAEGTNPVEISAWVVGHEGSPVTFSDTSEERHETGVPGIGGWRNNAGHSVWVDDISVDDLTVGGGIAVPVVMHHRLRNF